MQHILAGKGMPKCYHIQTALSLANRLQTTPAILVSPDHFVEANKMMTYAAPPSRLARRSAFSRSTLRAMGSCLQLTVNIEMLLNRLKNYQILLSA
jgi:hypothetical protein